MLDLSPQRVAVLQQLNEAKIPVIAWLLLPKEEGYWFHSGNAERAFERYQEVKKWAQNNDIQFDGIGIDIEFDFTEIDLVKNNKLKFLQRAFARLYKKEEFLAAKEKYEKLINTIRKDSFTIESYYIPFFRKESEKGRTALQQATRFMDLETDKDIPMIYTSFIGNPYGMLTVLATEENLKYVAIGSTGGGIDPTLPRMSWEDLAYDLRLAAKTAKEIHIFCLEASVEQGFIPQLIGFDFDAPYQEYPEQSTSVKKTEKRIMQVSYLLSHPTLLLLSVAAIFGLIVLLLFRLAGRLKRMIR